MVLLLISHGGLIIKLSTDGVVEWAKVINSGKVNEISETIDGNYIIGGYVGLKTVDLGDGIIVTNSVSGFGIVAEYSIEGKAQWAKTFGTTSYTYIRTVCATSVGGFIAGGTFSRKEYNFRKWNNVYKCYNLDIRKR